MGVSLFFFMLSDSDHYSVCRVSDGLIEDFIYPSRLQVDIKRSFSSNCHSSTSPLLFTFHTDCYNVLRARGCKLPKSKLLCLGSTRNRLFLPQSQGEPLLLLERALLQLNNDALSKARDELEILFRLPLELQYKVARLASPSAYSRFGVAITRTAPLLEEMHNPVSMSLEALGRSQEKPRLANLASPLDITNIASRCNQMSTRDAPQSRKIRVRIGPFGVQNIEVGYGKLCDRPSPWVEVIELPYGEGKLIGVHNVRTTNHSTCVRNSPTNPS